MKASSKGEIVSDACQQWAELPNLTVARMVYKAYPHLWPSLNAVCSAVRYRRGNCGNRHRRSVKGSPLVRPNGKAGFHWEFPKSSAPGYTAFELDAAETLILSELHIPFHDTPALVAVIARARKRNPHCILLNGDVCDFFSISRFEKNPKESSLKDELDLTRQFLGWLRQSFPKARIIYKLGNHDEWFDRYLWRKAPELYKVSGVSLRHLTTAALAPDKPEVGGIEWVEDRQAHPMTAAAKNESLQPRLPRRQALRVQRLVSGRDCNQPLCRGAQKSTRLISGAWQRERRRSCAPKWCAIESARLRSGRLLADGHAVGLGSFALLAGDDAAFVRVGVPTVHNLVCDNRQPAEKLPVCDLASKVVFDALKESFEVAACGVRSCAVGKLKGGKITLAAGNAVCSFHFSQFRSAPRAARSVVTLCYVTKLPNALFMSIHKCNYFCEPKTANSGRSRQAS